MARPLRSLAAGLALGAAALTTATTPAQAAGTGTVTVIHGVPGVTVDVCVNGTAAISGFTYKSQKMVSLPAGSYDLGIVPTGKPCTAGNYLATASAPLAAGQDASVVAYLTTSGKPTLGLYANDLSAVPAGQGRLVLSHNANAPTVRVVAGTSTLVPSLAPGSQAAVVVPAQSYSGVSVQVASSGAAAISNATVPVAADADTIIYVVGDSAAGYSTVAQTIPLTSSAPAPGSVVTGNSPVGSTHDLPLAGLAGILAAAGALFGVSLRARRRRSA